MQPPFRYLALFSYIWIISCSLAGAADGRSVSSLWHNPGAVHKLDMAAGPGGAALRPRPPFHFLAQLPRGTSVKVRVRDGRGREWVAKWGTEVKPENLGTRLAWACGYWVRPSYFVAKGVIHGAPGPLGSEIGRDGSFREARFQLWDTHVFRGHDWSWSYNPFLGTRELNGLKILVMLTSNWDDKDARNVGMGSNTAIQEYRRGPHVVEYRYLITDWGGSFGRMGLQGIVRNKWDCAGYTEQTPSFVRGIRSGVIEWGYTGTNNEVREGITPEDVSWLLRYLGRISDSQLVAALRASGATAEETACFKSALRRRIDALRKVSK